MQKSGVEQDELAVLGEDRAVQVVQDVQSVLGEDRAVQVVLRIVVGCDESKCGKDQQGDDVDDRRMDPFMRGQR